MYNRNNHLPHSSSTPTGLYEVMNSGTLLVMKGAPLQFFRGGADMCCQVSSFRHKIKIRNSRAIAQLDLSINHFCNCSYSWIINYACLSLKLSVTLTWRFLISNLSVCCIFTNFTYGCIKVPSINCLSAVFQALSCFILIYTLGFKGSTFVNKVRCQSVLSLISDPFGLDFTCCILD